MFSIIRMLASKAGWIALCVVAVTIALAVVDRIPDKFRDWRSQATNVRTTAQRVTADSAIFSQEAERSVASANEKIKDLKDAGLGELDRQAALVDDAKKRAEGRVLGTAAMTSAALTGDFPRIRSSYLAQYVEIPLLDRSDQFISLRQLNLKKVAAHILARNSLNEVITQHNKAGALYNRAFARNRADRMMAAKQWRNPVCRTVSVPRLCDLARNADRDRVTLQRTKALLDRSAAKIEARKAAMKQFQAASENIDKGFQVAVDASREYKAKGAALAIGAKDYTLNTAFDTLVKYGGKALLIVLLAALLPILHKLFAFTIIAPLANGAAPVRLAEGLPALSASESKVSLAVPIGATTELLLRSGLQSSPADVTARDKLVLDWAMPISCVAAGLTNLQLLRSDRSEVIHVVGMEAEHRVMLIDVPETGAVVLQPRALLGVVKRRGDPLRISRPWRVRWLISWVTTQFRYVVFHGPCSLIVQGNNGVQVEDARSGRMINKRLTLGFDASVAYGAARSASFLPYLRGTASLFNDKFGGSGHFIYEQRASSSAKGSIWGRGLKGIGDVLLNALGI